MKGAETQIGFREGTLGARGGCLPGLRSMGFGMEKKMGIFNAAWPHGGYESLVPGNPVSWVCIGSARVKGLGHGPVVWPFRWSRVVAEECCAALCLSP